jgi:hypothetical protein
VKAMSNDLRKQIHDSLNLKETDELVEIWATNDRVEWSEPAFDVLKEILEQRLGEVPPQNDPVLEHVESEIEDNYDENLPLDKFSDPNNAPVCYKPKEVLWVNLWLNRVAIAAVVTTVLVSIPEISRLQSIVLSYFMGNIEWRLVSWLIALVVDGLAITLQCFIVYFSLKALASILKILMEMEFNSRATK